MQSYALPRPSRVITYPDSDGQPMAENTLQYEWIVTIKGGIDSEVPDFVGGDLLWYPVEYHPEIRVAPDVLVALGRPKGYRGSYRQWEEDGIAPQVVFEILSPGNRVSEMMKKHQFYERYGVQEYYLYDPDENVFLGWIREMGRLVSMPVVESWVSPLLGIRFEMGGAQLQLFHRDGSPFLTFAELTEQAKAEKQRADQEQRRADEEQRRADEAQQRAEEERKRADEALARLAALEAKLKALGL